MSDPNQPDAGNLFLAVATQDGKVHSTTRKESDGTWSPFDEVSSPAREGGRATGVSVTRNRRVVSVDDLRDLRAFEQGAGTWSSRLLPSGLAPASANVGPHQGLAVVGLGAPTLPGWSFGLPLLVVDGTTIAQEGDQLANVDPGDLPPGELAVALDSDGVFLLDGWNFNLCLVTASGGLFYTPKAIAKGTPFGPPARFENVKSFTGDPGPLFSVSCSGGNSGVHVCAVDGAGRIQHAIRQSDGTWTSFGDVNAVIGGPVHIFTTVAISDSNLDNSLHVAAADDLGGLWHTIRRADGTWYPFDDVKSQAGDPGFVTSVDVGAWFWLIT